MKNGVFHSFSPEKGIGEDVLAMVSANEKVCVGDGSGASIPLNRKENSTSFPLFKVEASVRFMSHHPSLRGEVTPCRSELYHRSTRGLNLLERGLFWLVSSGFLIGPK